MKPSRLRSNPDAVRAWQDRSRQRQIDRARAEQARGKRQKAPIRVDPDSPPRRRGALPGARGWTQRVFTLYGRRCLVCGARAVQAHHVVPRQAILAARHLSAGERVELAYDARNGFPTCVRCHERHETATERIPFDRLPPAAVEWAVEHGFRQRVFDRRIYPREVAA